MSNKRNSNELEKDKEQDLQPREKKLKPELSINVIVYLHNIKNKDLIINFFQRELFYDSTVRYMNDNDELKINVEFQWMSEKDVKKIISKRINNMAERVNKVLQYKIGSDKKKETKNVIKSVSEEERKTIGTEVVNYITHSFLQYSLGEKIFEDKELNDHLREKLFIPSNLDCEEEEQEARNTVQFMIDCIVNNYNKN